MSKFVWVVGIGYLLGNFATSYLLGKIFKHKDIRNFGSGNAGATNALRVFGVKIAIITFICDALKGAIAVIIGRMILGDIGGLIAGVSAVIGHNWPVVLKFKGGKGIACSIGVLVIVRWEVALISFVIGILIIIKTKYVSLGSVTASIMVPILGLILVRPFDLNYFIFTIILAIMATFKHRTNINRLINGVENKLGQKVK